MIYFEIMKSFK